MMTFHISYRVVAVENGPLSPTLMARCLQTSTMAAAILRCVEFGAEYTVDLMAKAVQSTNKSTVANDATAFVAGDFLVSCTDRLGSGMFGFIALTFPALGAGFRLEPLQLDLNRRQR